MTAPHEHPALFSAGMVQATLDNLKTQTRLPMKPQPHPAFLARGVFSVVSQWPLQDGVRWFMRDGLSELVKCPFGKPGDRLFVKEAWRTLRCWDDLDGTGLMQVAKATSTPTPIQYECDHATRDWMKPQTSPLGRYRHARFMPRWASRLALEISEIRVQRVQDISEADAMAEGFRPLHEPGRGPCEARWAFRLGWDAIYAKHGPKHIRRRLAREKPTDRYEQTQTGRIAAGDYAWAANPYVWAITFRRLT